MGRRKQPPEYFEARTVLNKHLYRHHEGSVGINTLADRLTQHEELHLLCRRTGIPVSHSHAPYPEGESDIEAALRMFSEGEQQHGQSDIAEGSGSAGAVVGREAKRRRRS